MISTLLRRALLAAGGRDGVATHVTARPPRALVLGGQGLLGASEAPKKEDVVACMLAPGG